MGGGIYWDVAVRVIEKGSRETRKLDSGLLTADKLERVALVKRRTSNRRAKMLRARGTFVLDELRRWEQAERNVDPDEESELESTRRAAVVVHCS